ncbi:MAG: molybdopterin-dependent oxidoreductase [Chloroflexi bacterium]|nr:molybdopterin-dependent oxidoreductase [Chloroflexota bacterium]
MSRRHDELISRRWFLRYGGLGLLGWLAAACGLRVEPPATPLPGPVPPTATAAPSPLPPRPTAVPPPSPTPTVRRVAPSELLHNENRPGFYIRYVKPFPPPDAEAWRLAVEGLVAEPITLSLDEIEARLPLVEQVSRLKCVECWSAKAEWGGFTYQALAELVQPLSEATHVHMQCLDGYWEVLPIEELARPRALFVHRMNGERLPPPYGSPLRLILPWLYGYKGAKAIATLEFKAEGGRGYWSTVAAYSPEGVIQPGFDHPLDLEDKSRQIEGGEITDY